MGLLLMIVAVAGLFLALHAQFLAASSSSSTRAPSSSCSSSSSCCSDRAPSRPATGAGLVGRGIGGGLFASTALAGLGAPGRPGARPGAESLDGDFGSIDAFGRALFSDGLVPFELSSALLMVAVLGAVAVARGRQGEAPTLCRAASPASRPRSPRPALAALRATAEGPAS